MKELIALSVPWGESGSFNVGTPENIPTLAPEGPFGASGIIGWIISIIIVGLILLSFGYILYGGFLWITSQGDKQKIESARKTIIFAVIGIIIALLSITIINIASGLFGFGPTPPPPTICEGEC